MAAFIEASQTRAIISAKTPLLANLSMLENIALIKEVHGAVSIDQAEAEAIHYLSKINLQHLQSHSIGQCSSLDLFSVMLIRALMFSPELMIVSPFNLINNLESIDSLVQIVVDLKIKNTILIVDIERNDFHYVPKIKAEDRHRKENEIA